MNKKSIFVYILSFFTSLTVNNSAQAQSMHPKIEPQFSGEKPKLRPTTVSIDSNQKYELTYPQAGSVYQIGKYIPVDPSPDTAGSRFLANYYLVDNQGIARLVNVQGGFSCGNDSYRVNLSSNEIYGVKVPETSGNGEVLPPGEYKLAISKGGNGYSQSTRSITGDIIAQSGKFKLVSSNTKSKPARFSGLISLAPFNPKYNLPPNARDEFFNRILTIFLTSEDYKSQVKIHANNLGRFDVLVPPGNYVIQSRIGIAGLDRHIFFCNKSLFLTPTKEEKITLKANESYEMNFYLKDNDEGDASNTSHLNYNIQSGEFKTIGGSGD